MDNERDRKLIKNIIMEDRQLRSALAHAPPPEPSMINTSDISQMYKARIKVNVQRATERAKLNIRRAIVGEPYISRASWIEMEEEVEREAEAKAAAEVAAMAFAEQKSKKEITGWDRHSIRKCRAQVLRARQLKTFAHGAPTNEEYGENTLGLTQPESRSMNPNAASSNTTATAEQVTRLAAQNQRYLNLVKKIFRPDYVVNEDEHIDLWLSIHNLKPDPTVRVSQVEHAQTPADRYDTVAHNKTRDAPSRDNPFASLFNCRRHMPQRYEVFDEVRNESFKIHDTLQEWLRDEYDIAQQYGCGLRAVDIARRVLRSFTNMVGYDPYDALPVVFSDDEDFDADPGIPSNSRSNSFSNQSTLSVKDHSSASLLNDSLLSVTNQSSLSLLESPPSSPSDSNRPVVKRRTSSALFKMFGKSEIPTETLPVRIEDGEAVEGRHNRMGPNFKLTTTNAFLVRWITRCEENDW